MSDSAPEKGKPSIRRNHRNVYFGHSDPAIQDKVQKKVKDYLLENPLLLTGAGNVAAVLLDNGDIDVVASNADGHAENVLLDRYEKADPRIKILWTELQPCDGRYYEKNRHMNQAPVEPCKALLRNYSGLEQVWYYLPYGQAHAQTDSNKIWLGIARKNEMFWRLDPSEEEKRDFVERARVYRSRA
jgi:hypothetical protein